MPTTQDTTRVIDRLHTQERQEHRASLNSRPGPSRSSSLLGGVFLLVLRISGISQRSASGSANNTGSTASAIKPACQFQPLIAQVVISGSMIAANPEPLRM